MTSSSFLNNVVFSIQIAHMQYDNSFMIYVFCRIIGQKINIANFVKKYKWTFQNEVTVAYSHILPPFSFTFLKMNNLHSLG